MSMTDSRVRTGVYPDLERERQMTSCPIDTPTVTHTKIASPLGELTLVAEDDVLVDLYFPQLSGRLYWPARARPPRPGRGLYFYNRASFGVRTDVGFEASATSWGSISWAGGRTSICASTRGAPTRSGGFGI